MLSELLQKVKAYRERIDSDRVSPYQALVRELADGVDDIEPEHVSAIVEEAGKSLDQLNDDVGLLLQRREWKRQLDVAADADGVMKKAKFEIDRLAKERDAYAAKLNAQIDQHRAALDEAERRLHSQHSAREMLGGSCTDTELLRREQEAAKMLGELIPEQRETGYILRKIEASIADLERQLEQAEHEYKRGFTPGDRQAIVDRIDNIKVSLRNRRAEYRRMLSNQSTLGKDIASWQLEIEEVAKLKLIP